MCAGRTGCCASSIPGPRVTFGHTTRRRLRPKRSEPVVWRLRPALKRKRQLAEVPNLLLTRSELIVWRRRLVPERQKLAWQSWKRSFGVCAAALECHLANGSDTVEGFTAEAERGDAVEVGGAVELAGCVPVHG